MKIKAFVRYGSIFLLVVAMLFTADTVLAQERGEKGKNIYLCQADQAQTPAGATQESVIAHLG